MKISNKEGKILNNYYPYDNIWDSDPEESPFLLRINPISNNSYPLFEWNTQNENKNHLYYNLHIGTHLCSMKDGNHAVRFNINFPKFIKQPNSNINVRKTGRSILVRTIVYDYPPTRGNW